MPTFGEWERVVLEHCYDVVDYVSCHAYYQIHGDDLGTFLASSLDMEKFIATVAGTADHIKAKRRSDKTINLSFDEWNVWYVDEHMEADPPTTWEVAPHALENVYTVADAVVVGNLLITLLKHADRVTAVSLAQLVNAIAPIMTEPEGPAWRQTTFHPFAATSRLARGVVLEPRIECGTYVNDTYGEVPLVDAVATFEEESGQGGVFLVNRDTSSVASVEVDVSKLSANKVAQALTLSDDDVFAVNTVEQPQRVHLHPNPGANLGTDGILRVELPAVSWTAISLSVDSAA
jgi:alpha-N-arabinofuranosidase